MTVTGGRLPFCILNWNCWDVSTFPFVMVSDERLSVPEAGLRVIATERLPPLWVTGFSQVSNWLTRLRNVPPLPTATAPPAHDGVEDVKASWAAPPACTTTGVDPLRVPSVGDQRRVAGVEEGDRRVTDAGSERDVRG